jgi:hypothetical protein
VSSCAISCCAFSFPVSKKCDLQAHRSFPESERSKQFQCMYSRILPKSRINMRSDDRPPPNSQGKAYVTRSYLDLVLSTSRPISAMKRNGGKREAIRSAFQGLWNSIQHLLGRREPRRAPIPTAGRLGGSRTITSTTTRPITVQQSGTGRLGPSGPATAPLSTAAFVKPSTYASPPSPAAQPQTPAAPEDWDDGGAAAAAAAARAAESARLEQLMEGYLRRHAGQTGPTPARPAGKPTNSISLAIVYAPAVDAPAAAASPHFSPFRGGNSSYVCICARHLCTVADACLPVNMCLRSARVRAHLGACAY